MTNDTSVKKIALVGTISVGKTTLINHFRKKYATDPRITFVNEAGTEYFKKNGSIKDRFNVKIQKQIQSLAISNEEMAIASGAKIILCDRSVIDQPIFLKYFGDHEGSKELHEKVKNLYHSYYKFFLLDPYGINFKKDNIRVENNNDMQKLHEDYLKFFAEEKIPFEILGGTLKERTNKIDKFIKELI